MGPQKYGWRCKEWGLWTHEAFGALYRDQGRGVAHAEPNDPIWRLSDSERWWRNLGEAVVVLDHETQGRCRPKSAPHKKRP